MLSVVIPIFNEEGAVHCTIERTAKALDGIDSEIIAVNDGSTDQSKEIFESLSAPSLSVLSHDKNRGNASAIMTGVKEAKGEWIATIDADNTYAPEDIRKLWDDLQNREVDMIVGSRQGLEHAPWIHVTARHILRRFGEILFSATIPDINSGLRIVKKSVIEKFSKSYPKRFSLHIVLTLSCFAEGMNVRYVPISYGQRIGRSKLSGGMLGMINFLKFLTLMLLLKTRYMLKIA